MTDQPPIAESTPDGSRRAGVNVYQVVLCGAMIFGGMGVARSGIFFLDNPDRLPIELPVVEGTPPETTHRTVVSVVVLLGVCLTCLGITTGAKALRRRDTLPQRKRATRRPPAGERPYADRLARYLEEQPAGALRSDQEPRRPIALFLSVMPGNRHGPKSPSAIRRVLLRIHRLLAGGR